LEEDTDDKLNNSPYGKKEKITITQEFVWKNRKALMSELKKMDREDALKGVAPRLTYGTPMSGNTTTADTPTPSSAVMTKTHQ
jgi:hypothetical protein